MIEGVVGLLVVGVMGLVALALIGAIVGLVVGLAVLAAKVAALVFVGWVVVKLVRSASRPRGVLTAADQRWLDRA